MSNEKIVQPYEMTAKTTPKSNIKITKELVELAAELAVKERKKAKQGGSALKKRLDIVINN